MWLDRVVAGALCGFTRLLTGVQALWRAPLSEAGVRVYYANHRSHGDFVLVWSSLPALPRQHARPVAAADYWLGNAVCRYLIQRVFRGVLIDRQAGRDSDPVGIMSAALRAGDSLILFPEGTRSLTDELQPFKAGIYHLARQNPRVEFVPVWIENLGRTLPKGHLIPLPLLCSVTFGVPLRVGPDESRDAFLDRARDALVALAPPHHD